MSGIQNFQNTGDTGTSVLFLVQCAYGCCISNCIVVNIPCQTASCRRQLQAAGCQALLLQQVHPYGFSFPDKNYVLRAKNGLERRPLRFSTICAENHVLKSKIDKVTAILRRKSPFVAVLPCSSSNSCRSRHGSTKFSTGRFYFYTNIDSSSSSSSTS